MRITLSITALALSTLLNGCSFYTPYAPSNFFFGGYRETELGGGRFRVVYGRAMPDRAFDLALLRAAELSLEHGYTCFAIIQTLGGRACACTHGYVIQAYREKPEGVLTYEAEIQKRTLKVQYGIP